MRSKLLILIIVVALCGCSRKTDEAESKTQQPEKVYVTQFGEDFHRKNCPKLNEMGAKKGMSIAEAEDMGYTPCEECKPGTTESR